MDKGQLQNLPLSIPRYKTQSDKQKVNRWVNRVLVNNYSNKNSTKLVKQFLVISYPYT